MKRPAWGLSEGSESPIQAVSDPGSLIGFSGDDFKRAHAILWDKDQYLQDKGGIPAVSEEAPVIIMGGGISGLVSAHALMDLNPLVLEQAKSFGGNAKGERWQETAYGIGAAYIGAPAPGSPTASLLDELGVFKSSRLDDTPARVAYFQDACVSPYWSGATDPAHSQEFVRVWQAFRDIREKAYPDIPLSEDGMLTSEQVRELDQISFATWVAKNLGSVHPHIEEFFHEYCWSSFGGAYDEVSAAQALNFLSADLGGTIAFPGGNAAVAQALYQKLVRKLGSDRLRAQAFVVDVAQNSRGVRVCYESPDGKLRSVQAKACIVASPKFVATRVISGYPADRAALVEKLRYRAFVVANVLLNQKAASPSFDMFKLTGSLPAVDHHALRDELDHRVFTDLVFANWASETSPGAANGRSVLTLFKPYPYEGGRRALYQPSAYAEVRKNIESSLPRLLAALRISDRAVRAVRITRWGHALPLAKPGLIAEGTLEKIAAPMGNQIFFAEQDNWANPSFECALECAVLAASQARSALAAI